MRIFGSLLLNSITWVFDNRKFFKKRSECAYRIGHGIDNRIVKKQRNRTEMIAVR